MTPQIDLAKEGRSFVREGTILRKDQKVSEYMQVFLLTDVLLCTIDKKGSYKLKNTIILSDVTVSDIPDTESTF